MSIYVYRANNNELRFFTCNECGSLDLNNPHNSESDHRDVLRFKCNKCNNHPYFSWVDTSDVILVTKKNVESIKQQMCEEWGKNPNEYVFSKEIKDVILNDQ